MAQISVPAAARTNERPGLWLLCLGLWTLFVVLALWLLLRENSFVTGGPDWIIQGSGSGLSWLERTRNWFRLAHLNFQRIYPWVLFGPYVFWLTSRFHLDRGLLTRNLAIQLAGCALFALGSHAVNARLSTGARFVVISTQRGTFTQGGPGKAKTFRYEFSGVGGGGLLKREETVSGGSSNAAADALDGLYPDLPRHFPTNLLPELKDPFKTAAAVAHAGPSTLRPLSTFLDLLAYGSLAGLAHAVYYYRRYRERERRALFLESNLARARFDALQAQLQPHFLFNTLNAIATLLRRDPKAAEATLMSLSELLRLTLSQSDRQEIPLRDELRFLERYMEIQQTRFGDRLRVELAVEPLALDCLVPALLLQPLVENAIRHGLEPSPDPGFVRVAAKTEGARLEIRVEDNGVGLGSGPQRKVNPGIGLSNLRARLDTLYGPDHSLELEPRSGGGAVVRIGMPSHQCSSPLTANAGT